MALLCVSLRLSVFASESIYENGLVHAKTQSRKDAQSEIAALALLSNLSAFS